MSTMAMYGRAAVGLLRRSRPPVLPDTEPRLHRVTADLDHLAEYDRVCGFRLAGTLPPTYPHVLAFPLGLRLMSRPDFPLPVIGLVHVANRIEVLRPVAAGEPLDVSVRAVDLRPHERGRQFDVVAVASVDGEVVWRGLSTYLRKEKPRGDGNRQRPAPPPAAAVVPPAAALWRVPARTGTDYAAVSGDHNPIHTSAVGARLFGFRRRVAHGMWSKARCLAALEGRLPDQYTVEVSFKRPILLPAKVALSVSPVDGVSPVVGGGWRFSLRDARSAAPHLVGTVLPDRADSP